ncbi:MAG: hypothetical protein ACOYYU_05460 [Chloroflexota bacterium]
MVSSSQFTGRGSAFLSQRYRTGLSFCVLLAAALVAFAPELPGGRAARAQKSADLTLSAQAGFDGYCMEGEWIPVQVTVENRGAGLEARVQVATKTGQEGNAAYAVDVSLPTVSRKQFFLYVQPPEILRTLTVSLVSEGETLAKQQLKVSCLSPESLLVGLLVENPAPYAALNAIQLQDGFVRVAELQPSDLPGQAQGWDALDALVVSGVDTGVLTAEQRQALELWLAGGGQLLAVGGPRWQVTLAGLEEFLPVEVSGSRSVADLSALSSYFQGAETLETGAVLASGRMREGARALVWQEGVPLLAVREIGFGRVWFLAADPGLQPLNKWNGIPALYTQLFAERPFRPPWADGKWDTYEANRALSTLSELGIPSILLICGWLGLYVMVVGPLNFLFLRRVKRPDLAWVTVPALVVGFTFLAYLSGFLTLGRKPALNRLAVVQAWEGVEDARVHALVGVYSPRRAMYTLESGDGFLSLPFSGSGSDLQSGGWLSLRDGAQTVLPDVRVESGGMKTVALDGNIPALPLEHDLVITVDDLGATLAGQVTNLGAYPLRDAMLVTPGGYEELGDLSPGDASPELDLSLQASSGNMSYYDIFPSSSYYYGSPWSTADDEESVRKEALFQAALSTNSAYISNWGVFLMGWLDESALEAGLRDAQPRVAGATLYIALLEPSVAYGPGLLRLPPSLFAWESSLPDRSPYSGYGFPPEGHILRFKVALPLPDVSVRILTLDLDGAAGADLPRAFLWDFESETWAPVQYQSWGSIDVPAPWRYVSADGEVRLKLEGDQSGWYEIYRSTVTLVVGP